MLAKARGAPELKVDEVTDFPGQSGDEGLSLGVCDNVAGSVFAGSLKGV